MHRGHRVHKLHLLYLAFCYAPSRSSAAGLRDTCSSGHVLRLWPVCPQMPQHCPAARRPSLMRRRTAGDASTRPMLAAMAALWSSLLALRFLPRIDAEILARCSSLSVRRCLGLFAAFVPAALSPGAPAAPPPSLPPPPLRFLCFCLARPCAAGGPNDDARLPATGPVPFNPAELHAGHGTSPRPPHTAHGPSSARLRHAGQATNVTPKHLTQLAGAAARACAQAASERAGGSAATTAALGESAKAHAQRRPRATLPRAGGACSDGVCVQPAPRSASRMPHAARPFSCTLHTPALRCTSVAPQAPLPQPRRPRRRPPEREHPRGQAPSPPSPRGGRLGAAAR